jgi:hypothetical protein
MSDDVNLAGHHKAVPMLLENKMFEGFDHQLAVKDAQRLAHTQEERDALAFEGKMQERRTLYGRFRQTVQEQKEDATASNAEPDSIDDSETPVATDEVPSTC